MKFCALCSSEGMNGHSLTKQAYLQADLRDSQDSFGQSWNLLSDGGLNLRRLALWPVQNEPLSSQDSVGMDWWQHLWPACPILGHRAPYVYQPRWFQLPVQSQILSSTYFFSLKEQHVPPKTFFDKPLTRIIRYIRNNGERRESKYILSAASPPPVPCKCHLWNIRLFVLKHKTFLPCSFSKWLGVFSVSVLKHGESLPDESAQNLYF